jgi:DNA topoisomerase-2
LGGKDSASPRYIFTYLEQITDKVFRKEDSGILKHLDDDGTIVEPEHYLPVLPMLLINGCLGIGTGFSTYIPQYNPSDIIRMLRQRLMGQLKEFEGIPMKPWWHGFKGTVSKVDDYTWMTKGVYTLDDTKSTITITELPVEVWTKDYKSFLDEMASAQVGGTMPQAFSDSGRQILQAFDDLYTDEEVKFVLTIEKEYYEEIKAYPEEFEKRFRLTANFKTTNMVSFNNDMKITRFKNAGQILDAFFTPRLSAYEQRRMKEIDRLESEAVEADAKARFIRGVLEGTIDLRRATDEQIMEIMKEHELPALSGSEDEKGVDAWDYLLRLRMDRVKASAVDDAEKAVMVAKEAVAVLKGTTAEQLWLHDLADIEPAWQKMITTRSNACASAANNKRAVKTVTKKK